MDDLLSVSECAKRRGLTPEGIRDLIRRNRLPARKIGSQFVGRAEDLAAYEPTSRAEIGRRAMEVRWGLKATSETATIETNDPRQGDTT